MADEKDKIAEMLDQVHAEVSALLKSSPLAKAHPGEATSPEVSPDASATAPPAPEASAPPAEGSASASGSPAEGSPSPEGSPPAEGSASASGSPEGSAPPPAEGEGEPSQDPAAEGDGSGDPVDPMALAEEYGKLSMPDLLTHYQAIKHVLAEKMPPPAPEAPAAESAPPPEAPAMGKSEAAPAAAAPAPEVVALQADLAASQQAIGHLVKAVEQALARPLRKAVTSLSDVAPSAAEADATKDMSPEEVTRRLRDAAKNPKLSKSDRDLINRYCFKQADLTQIKHLLAGA